MTMITVDISNIWGEVSLPDLLNLEKEIFDAHNALTEGTGAGSEFTGWLDLPTHQSAEEILRIQNLGKGSLRELEEKLSSLDAHLREE